MSDSRVLRRMAEMMSPDFSHVDPVAWLRPIRQLNRRLTTPLFVEVDTETATYDPSVDFHFAMCGVLRDVIVTGAVMVLHDENEVSWEDGCGCDVEKLRQTMLFELTMRQSSEYMTVTQLARIWQMSETEVRRLIHDGQLKAIRSGGRTYRISREQIREYELSQYAIQTPVAESAAKPKQTKMKFIKD